MQQNTQLSITPEKSIKSTIVLDINSKTVVNLMNIGSWINEKNNLFFKQYDLSSQQYNILKILRNKNGRPTTLSSIHDRMISKMCNTTRLIDKLKLKGLVTRRECKENRRKVEIRITKKGLELIDSLDEEVRGFTSEITKNVNRKEALIINELLDKLRGV